MNTIFYEIKRIPDLTLSKYSALDESGVDGVLKKQLAFLRQIHRKALLCKETVHWIYEYNPSDQKGKRLKIYLKFDSEMMSDYADVLVKNSLLAPYFDIVRVVSKTQIDDYREYIEKVNDKIELNRNKNDQIIKLNDDQIYEYMAVLIKREKFARADNPEHRYFYSVNKWEMNNNARLFNLFSMMKNMNQPCVYCVDVEPADYTNLIESPEMLGDVMLYLRNMLAFRIEKNSMGTSFQKDENADYTLNCYKELVKELAANPHFNANIRVYANSPEYASMLLDVAASESLDEGSHDIILNKGMFNIQSITNSKVNKFCNKETPRELTFLPTLFMIKELLPFVAFPVLYSGESIEIPKETVPVYESDGLYLGCDNDDFDVYIPLENLTKHAFLSGVPGSGKTNSMLHMATELYSKGIPFLILEPAKQEYRALVNKKEMKGITVFSPSSGTNFMLHINPFEFPTKMSLAEHIQNLIDVFNGSFSMDPPMPYLLDRAIERIYRDKGWLPYMINNGSLPYPTMEELYKTLEKILDETTDYQSDIKGNLKSILQVRIGSLLSREMGDVFDVPFSTIPPEEWLSRTVIIELESMGSGPSNFLTLMLSTLIRESLKVNPLTREEKNKKPVRHAIFFEEAHNLIGPKSEKDSGDVANPKIAATAYIVKMLAEVRALNEAIIIADQLPTAMAPEVIKNTSLKLGHRMTSADDRGLLGSTMSANEVQLERMATYTQGKALAIYEGLLKPFEIQMHQWSRVGDVVDDNLYTSPTNDDLYDTLCYDGSPFISDMKMSLDITLQKMDVRWKYVLEDVILFEEELNGRIGISNELERRINIFVRYSDIDWSKISEKGKKNYNESLKKFYESQEINNAKIEELMKRFHSLCDQMEEIIFALGAYRKQNKCYENDVKKNVTKKLIQYRDFSRIIKEKSGFERSQEQKDRRNMLLKQWE